jgi:AraC-like DNA-binding protein
MHHIAPFNGPYAELQNFPHWPQRLHAFVPGLIYMRKSNASTHRHTALPSDLFLITAYCSEDFVCGPNEEGANLEVVISALRSRPAEFVSTGGGAIAVALLSPLGLLQLFGCPIEAVTDRRIPLEAFCGRREQRDLRNALLGASTPQERLTHLSAWLERRLLDAPQVSGPARRVAAAASLLYQSRCDPPAPDAVAKQLASGRRQLERDFRRWLGTSLGAYGRLVRFQRAAAAVIAGQELMHVAADHGYSDQPHMTRAFRELATSTPGELATWGRCSDERQWRELYAGRLIILNRTLRPSVLSPSPTGGAGDGLAAR